MLSVPDPKKRNVRRNETRDLTKPIEVALNSIPDVWAARNTVGGGYHRNGDPATWGLGTGSADIIGHVRGRFFALEVKWPDSSLTSDQRRWHASMRGKGAFTAVVRSIGEAIEAVRRCDRGERE